MLWNMQLSLFLSLNYLEAHSRRSQYVGRYGTFPDLIFKQSYPMLQHHVAIACMAIRAFIFFDVLYAKVVEQQERSSKISGE